MKTQQKISNEEWEMIRQCIVNKMNHIISLKNVARDKNLNTENAKKHINQYRKILKKIEKITEIDYR